MRFMNALPDAAWWPTCRPARLAARAARGGRASSRGHRLLHGREVRVSRRESLSRAGGRRGVVRHAARAGARRGQPRARARRARARALPGARRCSAPRTRSSRRATSRSCAARAPGAHRSRSSSIPARATPSRTSRVPRPTAKPPPATAGAARSGTSRSTSPPAELSRRRPVAEGGACPRPPCTLRRRADGAERRRDRARGAVRSGRDRGRHRRRLDLGDHSVSAAAAAVCAAAARRAALARARLHAEPARVERRRVREEHAVLRRRPVSARAARPRQEHARAQRRRARAAGIEPPTDLDYDWDLDSHLLFDLPAAVAAVKRASGRDKIFYCGHSLGGILGYAYATLFDDLLGLITIGAPSDFARLPLWLRALSFGPLLAFPALDVLLAGANTARVAARALRRLPGMRRPSRAFTPWRFKRLPFRAAFRWLEQNLRGALHAPLTGAHAVQPAAPVPAAQRGARRAAAAPPRGRERRAARDARAARALGAARRAHQPGAAPRRRRGVSAHPHPARDLLRRRGPARVGAHDAQRVPRGVE